MDRDEWTEWDGRGEGVNVDSEVGRLNECVEGCRSVGAGGGPKRRGPCEIRGSRWKSKGSPIVSTLGGTSHRD